MKTISYSSLPAICILFILFPARLLLAGENANSGFWFTPNKGQWEEPILYKCDLQNGALFVEKDALLFNLSHNDDLHKRKHRKTSEKDLSGEVIRGHAYRMRFVGALPERRIEGTQASSFHYNYYLGNQPARWQEFVQSFARLKYHELYTGIDLDLYSGDGSLKYDFLVSAGADPSEIRLAYEGIEKMKLFSGNLFIETNAGRIIELKPKAWSLKGNEKIWVDCRFVLRNNVLSFAFPKGYDKTLPLVIDPVLVFASYTGSTADNWGYTATYDQLGYLYGGGIAAGTGYPVTIGAYQTSFAGGAWDVAISKFDTSGTFLHYATYLGGDSNEVPSSMVVNNNNQLYILGITSSPNFPVTTGCFNSTFAGGTFYIHSGTVKFTLGSDLFISKLSAAGGTLMSSTFIGGSDNDGFNNSGALMKNYADDVRGDIRLDVQSNVIVASTTRSTNFPVSPGCYQAVNAGGQDAVIFKLSYDLSSLIWSTYLGGTADDAAYSVVSDSVGNLYIAGGTASASFPVTTGAYQTTYQGGTDGFIAVMNTTGQNLISSTFYGTPNYDQIYFVDLDNFDVPYVTGQTQGPSTFYINNAAWNKPGGGQFVSKFSQNLASRIWSTTYGSGNGVDVSPSAFMIDVCGNIYISAWGGGNTNTSFLNSSTFGLPVSPLAFQTTTDGKDYYFLVIQNNASALLYGTFYGATQTTWQSGEHVDGGTSRFDKKGIIYQAVCAGCGGYSTFPTTPNAWSNTNKSFNCNMGVIKYDFRLPLLIADFQAPPASCAPVTINFVNTSFNGTQLPFTSNWSFGTGATSNQTNPSYTYNTSGVYTVRLIITSPATCNQADTITKQILVLSNKKDTLPPKNICPGQQIQIGIPPYPDPAVTYTWLPSPTLSGLNISNPVANPLTNTYYQLLISNGTCTDTLIQLVKVHYLTANAGNDTTFCTGSITLTGTGTGTSPISYLWSSNPSFSDTLNSSTTSPSCIVNAGPPSTYYLKIYDIYGCYGIDSVSLGPRIFPTLTVPSPVKCHNDCNGALLAMPIGGATPYSYAWSNGANIQNPTNLCPGMYAVTVTDNDGCFSVDSVDLINPPPLLPNLLTTNLPCEEVCIGKIQVAPTGGTLPFTYNWNNGAATPIIQNLCLGTYSITITDANGCQIADTITLIDLSLGTNIDTWQSKDTIYQGQKVIVLTTLLTGYTYSWQPPTGLNNPSVFNPVASPNQTTTYVVTVTDSYGCYYLDTIIIYVLDVYCEDPFIYVPNAFTPNNDGLNDVFYVRTLYAESAWFAVYNRWGECVFETTDLTQGWDGTFRGEMSQPGVYVFVVDVKCWDGRVFKKKGNVTLIR